MSKKITLLFFLFLLFLITLIYALRSGAVSLTWNDLIDAFSGNENEMHSVLLWQLRIPRILGALAVGGSLALAGVIMQIAFANPLVEPYTLGLSGASSLGVALVFLLQLPSLLGYWVVPTGAFLGAVPVVLFLFSSAGRSQFNMKKLLLTGVMISYISGSVVTLILSLSDMSTVGAVVNWGFGSLASTKTISSVVLLVFSVLVLMGTLLFSLPLNALTLGENDATTLGVSVKPLRMTLLIVATLLTAGSVSISGVIGFVGLLVPHMVRHLFSSDTRILLPVSWFVGGVLMLAADTIGRVVILPGEIPVGVLTGILGGVLFLFLIQRESQSI